MKISIIETSAPRSPDDMMAYQAIIEGAPVMLWLGDAQGKCLFLNREQRDFWGLEPDQIDSFDWSTTIHPEDVDSLSAPFQKAMQAQTGFEAEARYKRADGEYRVLHTKARPRFCESGTFLGMVGVNTDITDRRRAEANFRRSSEQLEFALESSRGIGTWVWDIAEDRIFVDLRFAQVFGMDWEAAKHGLPPRHFLAAIDEGDQDRV